MDDPQLTLAEELEILSQEILEFSAHPVDVYATDRRPEIQELLWRIEIANGNCQLRSDWRPTEAFLDALYRRACIEHVEPASTSDDANEHAPVYLDSSSNSSSEDEPMGQ
eukprot:GHVU01144797.1.p1 GENE.GHVU01144797.1~~GHVU01144797.1.p1  ORF type:complete len:110 (+),score=17.60 GHVU01144797.1:450-779(+)